MKKLIFIVFMISALITGSAFADDIGTTVETGMKKFFEKNNLPLEVKIDVIQKLDEPKGFYFIRMTLKEDKSGRQQEQFAFTDGKYIVPDILTVDSNTSMKDILSFNAAEKVDLDLSRLSLLSGKKNAKHVIVTVSDFQCPFCKKAHMLLNEEIKKRNLDVAVYLMHMPLSFHQKAKLYATIYEAGKMMGKDFADELYATDKKVDDMKDEDVVDMFAKKSGNPEKFKGLMKSPSIAGKIADNMKYAESLGITGTPQVYFDGKGVGGFKQSMFELGLDSLK